MNDVTVTVMATAIILSVSMLSGCEMFQKKDSVALKDSLEVVTPECTVRWNEEQVRDKGEDHSKVTAP